MYIYVFLKNVENLKGFKTDEFELSSLRIFLEDGRWQCRLPDDTSTIPSPIVGCVEEISLYTSICFISPREAGVYRHQTAIAEVDLARYNDGGVWNRIRIKAKELGDLRTLLHEIKIGAIRPEESYEGDQGGLSWKINRINMILEKLIQNRWPFCSKSKIIAELKKVMDQ